MERRNSQALALVEEFKEDSSDTKATYSIAENELELLNDAFQRFNDASSLLQKKYDSLHAESIELREQLRKKEEEIKKNERLATLGETAAALAHEIRNPLGAMQLYTSMLQQDLVSNPDQYELVTAIDRSIHSLNHVVSNILQFAKHRPRQLSPVAIRPLLQEMVLQHSQLHQHIEYTLRVKGELFLWGDTNSFQQLCYNLLLNAAQAQPQSGMIRILAVEGNDSIKIRVRDEGPGISEEVQKELFEPFTTTKSEGTGLGLAICREIVRGHHGEIVASNWPRGAEFTMTFPLGVGGEE